MKNIGFKFNLLLILSLYPVCAFSSESIEISGKILIPEEVKIPEGGLDVVLLKFVVNEQGEITTTGPQARVKSQPDGSFRILDVPRDLRAAYRIGTRVEGRLHQSNVVFLNDQDSSYQVEVQVPGISQKVELLELEKASLILERDLGKVRVTEVWEINNPSRDLIDSVNSGYRINLPKDISDFSMADETGQSSSDFRLGEHFLEIMRIFPPGNSQLIFQYSISSFLGQTVLTKSFGNSLEKVRIFTPCCHDIKAACVATVIRRSSVVALINGATNEPVPPTNIVAKEEITPIPIKFNQEGLIALEEKPQSE